LAEFSRLLATLQCRTRPSRCTEPIALNPPYIRCRRVDLAVGRVADVDENETVGLARRHYGCRNEDDC